FFFSSRRRHTRVSRDWSSDVCSSDLMPAVNIAIIGGGLVGASLALALQQGARERGWRIALIEPFAPGSEFQPSYDARASALAHEIGSASCRERVWISEVAVSSDMEVS